ncbi:type I polyketide synthase, partial [Gloeocapsa sp. PCC 73106]|uniref:type I polyketide synthase n=1 Tax=Gloeocapsa sp. PCC 73106 TaxID=102232 RepID=UPI0002AC9D04
MKPTPDYSSLMQNALLELREMRAKLKNLEGKETEPIAIVGMGCRFPKADCIDAFWELLKQGQEAITEVPENRWNIDEYYDIEPQKPGKMYTRYGGFIEQLAEFDPQFFGISPREAESLDPQQRLLLEVSWEALENGGIVPQKLQGSITGVFIGISSNDYSQRLLTRNIQDIDAYLATGNSHSVAAGRLSFTLGLIGPSLAVDTACSSSLVAVHLAVKSLRQRECNLAIVGGVNRILAPEFTINFCQARMLAADGRCKTFDASADGFVRSEGCGVIVLKRLSEAIASQDNILAIIRGSAVNQDGRSSGLTVPNGPSQQMVIQQALADAQVTPAQISYIEAHGTGTPLGDPIEIGALGAIFGQHHPLLVGSVKTNLGHLEAAAGIAGLIKVVLSLQHQEIPSHLHFQQPNPYIDWEALPQLKIPTQSTPWLNTDRLAGVSSFGFSGTNAHIILESAPIIDTPETISDRPLHLLTISAKSNNALWKLAQRYEQHLTTHPHLNLADICFSANTGRSLFPHRLSLIAASTTELTEKLREGIETTGILQERPKIAFLFTGQGSQYTKMGEELYQTQPLFRETLNDCAEILRPYLEIPLLDIIYPLQDNCTLLAQTQYTQPALFALEYALYQLWTAWGIQPDYVMGHSVGEYVAACVAGVFSLEDGLKLIAKRALFMQRLSPIGEMVAVAASEKQVIPLLQPYQQQVSVAAINGLENTVISGAKLAINDIIQILEKDGIKTQKLQVSHAFHSPLMEPILEDFESVAREINYAVPRLKIVSNLTGTIITDKIATPEYWCRHLRQPVRFAEGIKTLTNCDIFLEIGPKPTLLEMARSVLETTNESSYSWLPSLRNNQSNWQTILSSLAQLSVNGVNINWLEFYKNSPRRRIDLPTYPFERQPYWFKKSRQIQPVNAADSLHPLLGQKLKLANLKSTYFENELSLEINEFSFLQEHRILNNLVFPLTGYLEMTLAATKLTYQLDSFSIENFTIQQPLILSEKNQTVQFIFDPEQAFEIHASETASSNWLLHAQGKVTNKLQFKSTLNLEALKKEVNLSLDISEYYQKLKKRGFDYGDNFLGIKQLWRQPKKALGKIVLAENLKFNQYHIHPVLLDACLQVIGAIFEEDYSDKTYLPVGIEHLEVYSIPKDTELWSYVEQQSSKTVVDLTIFSPEGNVVIVIKGLRLKPVQLEAPEKDWLYEIEWRTQLLEASEEPQSPPVQNWLILADKQGYAQRLAERLGENCLLVFSEQDLKQILSTLKNNYSLIHLWSLDIVELDNLKENNQIIGGTTLDLLQSGMLTNSLYLVTRGAIPTGNEQELSLGQYLLWGLGKVIALEYPDLNCKRIDLDPETTLAEQVEVLLAEISAENQENQIAYRNNIRQVARLVRYPKQTNRLVIPELAESFELSISQKGTIENLQLIETKRRPPHPHEVEIKVQATGLNFIDVLDALGLLPFERDNFGVECAGEIVALGEEVEDLKIGDAVIALAPSSFSQYVTINAAMVVNKPECLSFVEAATIPANFLTAHYALSAITKGGAQGAIAKIAQGERILIHAAAGGTGMAAVQIALQAGAEVFATASPRKWDTLKAMGVKHTFNSRTLDFADEVMQITQGEGVDIVFNSLSGEFIPKSLAVLKDTGRFIEIGKRDVWTTAQVNQLKPNVSYFLVDLMTIAQTQPQLIQSLLQQLRLQFEEKTLQPLPYQSFPITDAVIAWRTMQQAKHIGKIILTPQNSELPYRGTYLITGGLGDLGLLVADWLITKGVEKVVLVSRNPANSQIQLGEKILVKQADVSQPEQIAQVIAEIEAELPPLKGVIHAAGVLDDGTLAKMSWSRFETVMAPKVQGGWNLHKLTKDLDRFILFSSAASLLGSPGQGNHVTANYFLDSLAHYRKYLGLPGLSINWGIWASIGAAARQKVSFKGIGAIEPEEGLAILEK